MNASYPCTKTVDFLKRRNKELQRQLEESHYRHLETTKKLIDATQGTATFDRNIKEIIAERVEEVLQREIIAKNITLVVGDVLEIRVPLT